MYPTDYYDKIRAEDRAQWGSLGFLALIFAAILLLGLSVCSALPAEIPAPTVEGDTLLDPLASVPDWIVQACVKILYNGGPRETWSGSGTVISNDGAAAVIVTCKHVLPNANGQITVIFPSGYTTGATWIAADPTCDLAICWILAGSAPAPIPVAGSMPSVGDWVCQTGYPKGIGPHQEFGTYRGPAGRLQTGGTSYGFHMHSDHGDSGSGIFNWANGYLTAVLWGGSLNATNETQACGAPDVIRLCRQYQSYLPPGWDTQCPGGGCQPPSKPPVGGTGTPPPKPPTAPTTPSTPTTPAEKPPVIDGPSSGMQTLTLGLGAAGAIGSALVGLNALIKSRVASAAAKGAANLATPAGQAVVQSAINPILQKALTDLATQAQNLAKAAPTPTGTSTTDPLTALLPILQQILTNQATQQPAQVHIVQTPVQAAAPATVVTTATQPATQVLVPPPPAQQTTNYVGVVTPDPAFSALQQAMNTVAQNYPGSLATIRQIQSLASQIQSSQPATASVTAAK